MALGNDASNTTQGSRNLFIAGLPPTLNDAGLEELFEPFGAIASAKVMVDLHTAKSRCFGFVLFQDEPSAVAAQQALNGKTIADGFSLVVNFSTAHSTTHLVEKSNAIYVRNIPKGTNVNQIEQHFSTFGEISNVEMLPDTAVGATGKFVVAKVTFTKTEVAVEAEKRTQCSTNVFAEALGGEISLKAPPLLAKLAENHHDRVRRIAQTRGGKAAASGGSQHHHQQQHHQAVPPPPPPPPPMAQPYMMVPQYAFAPPPPHGAAVPGQPWMMPPPNGQPMLVPTHMAPWPPGPQPMMMGDWSGAYAAPGGMVPYGTPMMMHPQQAPQSYAVYPLPGHAGGGAMYAMQPPGAHFAQPQYAHPPTYMAMQPATAATAGVLATPSEPALSN